MIYKATGVKRITPSVSATHVWAALRILMGWTFLWVFVDKLFGLGFPTEIGWIDGGNPTDGFMTFSSAGPLSGFYSFLADSFVIKTLLVVSFFIVGTGLVFGIWFRIAAFTGAAIYLVMWTARFPPTNNPISDDHLMGAFILVGLALSNAGMTWSLARHWQNMPFVTKHTYLK